MPIITDPLCPPPRRPEVVDEYLHDLELTIQVMWGSEERFKSLEESLGAVGPIMVRYITVSHSITTHPLTCY